MTDVYHDILKTYWGYDSFRGVQLEIIESIGAGRDTLGLMPTGGGKSVTFQVPALAMPGLCLVVTPLIALMKDQVGNLRARGIKAVAVYSGMSHEEVLVALENCIFGDYKFLYVSPERLGSELFLTKLKRMPLRFITVDEAHCISQWGYDFRPAYLKIAEIRTLFAAEDVPVLALTATATPKVVEDIQRQLGFRTPNVFRMSFERSNLAYVVRPTEDKTGELIHILNRITGSAIVYTRSRKGTREVAQLLKEKGMTALHYHAGLSNIDKDLRQRSWQEGETRVMVATNAFGMGIDKSDVRLVVHMDLPDSPEAYFQEAGRAGRDGAQAYAVLLYNNGDRTKLNRRIPDTFPDKAFIRMIYEQLAYFFQLAMGDGFQVTFEFNLQEFCRRYKHFPVPTDSALRILSRAGYIEYVDEEENSSRILFLVEREELYRLHNTSPDCEQMIQILLRNYGGLFSDYIYIEEALLASRSGFSPDRVYQLLKALNQQRIVHYIPRKRTPYITYLTRRVLSDQIFISPAVYEERRTQYEERIKAMIGYASSDSVCRSRFLLRYFGEKSEHNCLKCDVCTQQHNSGLNNGEYDVLRERILSVFADGEAHTAADLVCPDFDTQKYRKVLRYLIDEEEIYMEDGFFKRKRL